MTDLGHRPAPDATTVDDRRRALVERLEQVARHDGVTGLLRRVGTIERLAADLPGPSAPLVTFELRHLRALNAALGHSVVDRLLAVLANRLEDHPDVAWAGMLGPGAYCVALCPSLLDTPEEVAWSVLDRLRRPVELDRWVRVPDIVGALVEPTPGHLDPDQILRDLDTGVRSATEDRRLVVVDESLRSAGLRRNRVESDLAAAIAGDALSFRYQPIMDLASGRPVALEALARWRHPALGPIRPDEFIAVAEASGMILDLGDRAIDDTLAAMAAWDRLGIHPEPVHVNVSAVQLADPGLVDRVNDMLDRHDIAANRLEIEVTESAVLDTAGTWRRTLAALRGLGCPIAIDDFGAGFSSLLSLRDVQADTVKLDRAMLAGITSSDDARSLVGTTIDLAHRFGMTVVAEGVEEIEEAEVLVALGCDLGQGWLWHRDLDADEIADLWRSSPVAPT